MNKEEIAQKAAFKAGLYDRDAVGNTAALLEFVDIYLAMYRTPQEDSEAIKEANRQAEIAAVIESGVGKIGDAYWNEHIKKVWRQDPESWREEYLAKQSAGVRYEHHYRNEKWIPPYNGDGWKFYCSKEDYREVPQPTIPHLAERKLWLAQREAGTNEVWQEHAPHGDTIEYGLSQEPKWCKYCKYTFIPKPKPKTVTRYFALVKHYDGRFDATQHIDRDQLVQVVEECKCTIIGSIESREVEIG